jgi:hypothetical protein
MAHLAAISDLALITRLPADSAKLELALQRSSDRFRAAVHHNVTTTTGTLVLVGNGASKLLLPAINVTAVTAVRVDGTALASTDYRLLRRIACLVRSAYGVWTKDYEVEVDCTYGFATVPGDINDAVLEHAATIALSLAHVQQESAGATSAGYNQNATTGVTQKWVQAVNRYAVGEGDES